jgi:hypothetical protein
LISAETITNINVKYVIVIKVVGRLKTDLAKLMHFDKATSSDYHVMEITRGGFHFSSNFVCKYVQYIKVIRMFLFYSIKPLDLNLDNLLTVYAKITTDNIQGC